MDRVCEWCGTSLNGYRKDARFCGGPHRAAAARKRRQTRTQAQSQPHLEMAADPPADQQVKAPPAYPEPNDLGLAGSALWARITASYDLRADEQRVLEDACREADLIEALYLQLRGQSMTVPGSMGQDVINPLVQEIRQHRAILARLLSYVKLPDEGDDAEGERSASARSAALTRWSRRGP